MDDKTAVLTFLRFQGLDFKPRSADRRAFNEIVELIMGLDPAVIEACSFDALHEVLRR